MHFLIQCHLTLLVGAGTTQETEEQAGETVLDFEKEDGSVVQERELHIYALPLYWVRCLELMRPVALS
jgi:hypothetical protein